MRVTNRTHIPLPRNLMGEVARLLLVDGILPASRTTRFRRYWSVFYPTGRLRVFVRMSLSEKSVPSDRYLFGGLHLYCCPRCKPGSLFRIFLWGICECFADQCASLDGDVPDRSGKVCRDLSFRAFSEITGAPLNAVRSWDCARFPATLPESSSGRFLCQVENHQRRLLRCLPKLSRFGRAQAKRLGR